jgi:hypothetical protein
MITHGTKKEMKEEMREYVGLKGNGKCFITDDVLPRWTYRYPFDQQSQATLGPACTWMGDFPNEKYVGCCPKVYLHIVAWEGIAEDT